jgi:hypothetical protein
LDGLWLAPGEPIELPPYRLFVNFASGEEFAAPPQGLLERALSPPFPVVSVAYRDRPLVKRRLRAPLSLVGRYPGCALQLKGRKVSGFHCALYWEQQRLWCVDFNSSHLTKLNGHPILCEELQIGDRLDVGEFSIVLLRHSHSTYSDTKDRTSFAVPGSQAEDFDVLSEPDEPDACAGTVENGAQAQDTQIAEFVDPRLPLAVPASSNVRALRQPTSHEESQFCDWGERFSVAAAELAQAQRRLQGDLEDSSGALREQVARLQAQAVALAKERESLDQARRAWDAERDELNRQVSAQAQRLMRIESDLAVAKSTAPHRPLSDSGEAFVAALGEPTTVLALARPAIEARTMEAPTVEAPTVADMRKKQTQTPPALPAARHRGKVARDELTNYVGDRLVHLDQVRRRRQLLIWGGVVLSTGLAIGASFLAWNWLAPLFHP